MKRKYILSIISLLLVNLQACYLVQSPPEVLIKSDFKGENIAVLSFSVQGNYISSEIGKLTADKLTDALFIEGKYSVIDRSKVNEAQITLELKSPDFLSLDEIQKLGMKCGANYLILGRIQHISENEYIGTNKDKQIYISFRIISVLDSGVVGVATYSCDYKDNINQEIEDMVHKIVQKMKNV